MQKEEIMLQKRLIELSKIAYQRGIVTFSDFLNLNELNILHTTPKDQFPIPYTTFGGYAYSERQMAAFLPDAFSLYMEESEVQNLYPISIVKITPVHAKFAEEFEKEYVSQGYDADRDIEETLNIGWKLLSILPRAELKRIDDKYLDQYYGKF